jgi:hypothetical protein
MNLRSALANVILWTSILLPASRCAAVEAEAAKLGMEGTYFLRTKSPDLVVRSDNHSPVLLRIASQVVDGDSLLYEVCYVGTRAGGFDLRDYLRHENGNAFDEEPAILVQIIGTLAGDHDGRLDELAPPKREGALPYRQIFQIALVAWIVVSLAIIVRRLLRPRRRRAAAPVTTAPIDPLSPLLAAALAGELDAAGHARLEMLLLTNWITALKLQDLPTEAALAQLQRHPEAGPLLRRLEVWLHTRAGANPAQVQAIVDACRKAPSLAGAAS